jgi:hypothetical protein
MGIGGFGAITDKLDNQFSALLVELTAIRELLTKIEENQRTKDG